MEGTPIFNAIEIGDIRQVEELLENGGCSLKDTTVEDADTPLLNACYHGHIELVDWLIERGSEINEVNRYGGTVMFLAASGGQSMMLEHLVSKYNRSLTEKCGNKSTLLLEAAYSGYIETMKWLLDRGASLTERNMYGNDSLNIASSTGELETVRWLIEEKDCNIINPNSHGMTALGYAAKEGHNHIVKYLLQVDDSSAHVNYLNKFNETPLILAARHTGNLETLELLLFHGADMDIENYLGMNFYQYLKKRGLLDEFYSRRKSKQTKRVFLE